MKVRDALAIAERDTVPKCRTCTAIALDGEQYCWNCKSYWQDVDEGMFDYDDEF